MVATLALVDFLEQPATFSRVDAALVHARDAGLAELIVDDGVGVGSTLDLRARTSSSGSLS